MTLAAKGARHLHEGEHIPLGCDYTSLSYLTADAVDSLDEAVALVIELAELAIARGGHEGSLPPLRAIAIDPFGTLSVVGEDKTLEHPVRILGRTLKWLLRHREIPPEIQDLLERNSRKADDLDYPEELVNALLPFAPPDRTEPLSVLAKRLWQIERQALQRPARRSVVTFVPAVTRQALKAETRQLGHYLTTHRKALGVGGAVGALLLLVSVIGVPAARSALQRAAVVSASTLPSSALSEFLAQLPEPTAVPVAIALADPPKASSLSRAKRSSRSLVRRSTPRTRTASRQPSTDSWDAPERPNAAFRAIGQGSKNVGRAVGKGSMALFRAVGKGTKAVFRPGDEVNPTENGVQQSSDTVSLGPAPSTEASLRNRAPVPVTQAASPSARQPVDASSTSPKVPSRARRRAQSGAQ